MEELEEVSQETDSGAMLLLILKQNTEQIFQNGFLEPYSFLIFNQFLSLKRINLINGIWLLELVCGLSGIRKNNSNPALDYGVSKNDWSLRLGLIENF